MTAVSSLGGTAELGTAPRLQVWRTVMEAYAVTFGNLGYLLRISWAWVALMIPVSLIFYASVSWLGNHASAGYVGPLLRDVSSTILFQPFLASVAVAWHRRLLADEVWPGIAYLRFDRCVARYFALDLLVSLLFFGPVSAVTSGLDAGWSGWLILFLMLAAGAGLFVGTKIWLALPALALGKPETAVRQAWRASRRNFWRLIAGCVLGSLASVALLLLAGLLGPEFGETSEPLAYAAWETFTDQGITFLAGMPVISFLSLAYRRLMEEHSAVDRPASA
jgi:hypothetical protein